MLGAKLHMSSLAKLGFDRSTSNQLRGSIDKSADAEKLDPSDYVPLTVLKTHAQRLGIPPVLLGRLDGVLATRGTTPIKAEVDVASFPKAQLSLSDGQRFEAGQGDPVTSQELSAYRPSLEALFERAGKAEWVGADEIPSKQLQDFLREHSSRLKSSPDTRTGLTPPQIDKLISIVCGKSAPAHTERDLRVRVDSNFKLLHEKAGARVYQKDAYEGFSVKRTRDSQFVLHAIKTSVISVAVPPGHSLVIVDAEGNERGGKLPAKKTPVDGTAENLVDITRTMVEPESRRGRIWDPSFTVKVIDAEGTAVMEQAIAFGQVPSWTSNEIARGRFSYQPYDASEASARFVLDNAAPRGSRNSVPLGRRPQFEGGDNSGCDRLVIQRDGDSFAVADLFDLLRPAKGQTQAFSGGEGKRRYLLADDSRVSRSLDDPDRGWRPSAKLTSSVGDSFTFDPSLSQSSQARLGIGGITVLGAGNNGVRFDPFDPSQDLNNRKGR